MSLLVESLNVFFWCATVVGLVAAFFEWIGDARDRAARERVASKDRS